MHDGQMFGKLMRYNYSLNFYNENPFIITDALTGYDVWVIFAVYTGEAEYGYIGKTLISPKSMRSCWAK
jgi:hypothetical protein